MRVALIAETFLPHVNGVVTTLCRQLEHLQAHGHEAILFAPQGAPESYAGTQIVPLHGLPLPMYPELQLTPPQFGVTPRLRRFQPDILHLAGLAALGPTARYVAQSLSIPLVGAYHTDFPAYSTHYGLGFLKGLVYRYLRWIHNGCSMTLCPSSATFSDLRAHGFRRLRLWGRGVDTTRFHPRNRSEAWRTATGLQQGEIMLLYVGRLATEKRVELLIDAVRGLEGVRLVLVGDGPLRSELENRFAGLPVHFAGYLSGDTLATAYASADMFVFPSDTETFGQVIQEAMASGLPVVAAQAGGSLDLVRNDTTGLFFRPGDAQDLRTQIQHLADNPSRLAQMGRAGRTTAEQRSWERVMNKLLGYYNQVYHNRTVLRRYIRPIR